MSHVKIRPNNGGYAIEIDGHDIAGVVAPDGVTIQSAWSETLSRPVCQVTITLGEGVDVDLELPDALASIITPAASEDDNA